MTNEEAKEILEKWLEIDRHYYDKEPESDFDKFVSEQDEAVEQAIMALEKSIPRKPNMYVRCLKYTYSCPRCNTDIEYFINNYCSNCGQKLDWSNVKNGNESK